MKSLLFYLIIAIVVSVQSSQITWAVPKSMPDDFSVNYSFIGGMSPTYKTIVLKVGESSCKFRMNFDDAATEYTFQLKKEELTWLYNELRMLRAFSLNSKKVKVYDRGGESIRYTINSKNYNVSNSGMDFIIAAHSKAFAKSVLLITSMAAKYQP